MSRILRLSGRRVRTALLAFTAALAGLACNPVDHSVRAWIESRDAKGAIIAGATVEIDGQAVGMTDPRGLYRVKIRRRVGERVNLRVSEEGRPPRAWRGAFTVSSSGIPVETRGGRVIAVLASGAS